MAALRPSGHAGLICIVNIVSFALVIGMVIVILIVIVVVVISTATLREIVLRPLARV